MLKKFAVALVAASLIAGPVMAQGTTSATPNAPAATGQPAKIDAKIDTKVETKSTLNTHAVKKHVAHKHVTKKHVAKHHVKKVQVSKVKHGKAVKRIKKPVQNTLG